MKVTHEIITRDNEVGGTVEAIVRVEKNEGKEDVREEITTLPELYDLFDTCSRKWEKNGWDLNKLKTAIQEADFE